MAPDKAQDPKKSDQFSRIKLTVGVYGAEKMTDRFLHLQMICHCQFMNRAYYKSTQRHAIK